MPRINDLIREALEEFPEELDLAANQAWRRADKNDLFPLVRAAIGEAYREGTRRKEDAAKLGPRASRTATSLDELNVVDPIAQRTAFLAKTIWIPNEGRLAWDLVTADQLMSRASWYHDRAGTFEQRASWCEQWAQFLKDQGALNLREVGQETVFQVLADGQLPDPKEVARDG
jgi:hypothetical protein